MNPTLRNDPRRDAIYHAAVREHQADPCEWCGAHYNTIEPTRYGYAVVCISCGATLLEVDLDDDEPAAVYY